MIAWKKFSTSDGDADVGDFVAARCEWSFMWACKYYIYTHLFWLSLPCFVRMWHLLKFDSKTVCSFGGESKQKYPGLKAGCTVV